MPYNHYARLGRLAARDKHERFYQDLVKVFGKHTAHLKAEEMLAIAANMVGKLIALQDQRTMTVQAAMQLVAKNIEEGNLGAVEALQSEPPAGRA